MLRQLLFAIVFVSTAIGQVAAQDSVADTRVAVRKVQDVLTLWSVGRAPRENASHTYVLTHGLCGVDDRFYSMGQALLARNPEANVLVVDWSAGADRKIARLPNPFAAADRIDLTGDMLGVFLTKLSKKKCFDPTQATFIGESFGNCVNHRAALCLRKNGLKKAERAVVLNPAPSCAGYQTPLFTVPFKQSIACMSDSCLDARGAIANKRVLLKSPNPDQLGQHTQGMRWLQERIDAGEQIGSLFAPGKNKLGSLAGISN
jgi:hypothetical protein